MFSLYIWPKILGYAYFGTEGLYKQFICSYVNIYIYMYVLYVELTLEWEIWLGEARVWMGFPYIGLFINLKKMVDNFIMKN